MLFVCYCIAFIEVFLGVMISLERLAMATSSRAQKTKETGIDAEHRISVLRTCVEHCGGVGRYSDELCTCISLALLKFVHADRGSSA